MKNPFNGKTFIILATLALGAAVLYANSVTRQANEGVVFEPHVKGNPDASVTLVEYSDFQCPACAQFETHVSDILAEYGDQIRFEYKHFPLISIHPFAIPAARAAEAAGQQGKFWEMHDKLFQNQQIWSRSNNPVSYFNTYAEDIGLDIDLFKRHYKASDIKGKVEDAYREARDLGLSGTPSFFLNGEQMQITSFEDFKAQIEAAVASGAD